MFFPHKPQGTPGTLTFAELKISHPGLADSFLLLRGKFTKAGGYDEECVRLFSEEGMQNDWTFEFHAHGIWEADPNAREEDIPPLYYSPKSKTWMDENDDKFQEEITRVLF